jgi:DtxR family transcriptional regulator, Mn-dependent transcriptional regulator
MSESEEMYLVSIIRLQEGADPGPVPLSRLAGELNVLPVSANQMVRKLEDARLVSYAPYKGVELTLEGRLKATRILRHRRLWEVFLCEHLHIPPAEADQLACRMEHIMPPEAAERLAVFLGNPQTTPAGMPIPSTEDGDRLPPGLSLAELPLETQGRVVHIEADTAGRAFLTSEGLHPGVPVQVKATGSRGALLVQTLDGNTIYLTPALARAIRVELECKTC